MSERCKKVIITDSFPDQCSRKAVKDGLCNYHNPEVINSREEKRLLAYEQIKANNPHAIAIKRAEKSEQQRDALLDRLKRMVDEFGEHEGQYEFLASADKQCYTIKLSMELIAEIEGEK